MDRQAVLEMLRDGYSVNRVAGTLKVNRYRIAKLARELCKGCLVEFRLSILANKAKTLKALGIHWKQASAYMGVSGRTYFRLLNRKRIRYGEGTVQVTFDNAPHRAQVLDDSRLILTDNQGIAEIVPLGLVKGHCELIWEEHRRK